MLLAPLAARKQLARTATEFRIEDFEHRKACCTCKLQHGTVPANVIRHGHQQLFIAQAAATQEYCVAAAVCVSNKSNTWLIAHDFSGNSLQAGWRLANVTSIYNVGLRHQMPANVKLWR